MPYRILIVDDHALVRDGLALLVSTLPGGAQVFMAANAAQALEQAELHAPLDAVLLDCGLPDANGTSLIRALQARCAQAPVVVVSAEEAPQVAERVLQMGASAFVPKSKASANVLTALKLALAQGASAHASAPAQAPPADAPVLTARQLDILLMLDQGQTNQAIALQLGLAEKTIKNHITGLFAALGAVNRLQAIRQARNCGLLK